MSIVLCDNCARTIDSDYDCDCFVNIKTRLTTLCKNCRELAYDNICADFSEQRLSKGEAIKGLVDLGYEESEARGLVQEWICELEDNAQASYEYFNRYIAGDR